MADTNSVPKALIVDWGGVLTTPLAASMGGWYSEEGIDGEEFAALMKEWLGSVAGTDAVTNPVHDLETGRITAEEFGDRLAERMRRTDGSPLRAAGLVTRMFAGFTPEPAMGRVVLRAREHGLRTALLSNSWGLEYPREEWAAMFDLTVISGEVGLRKPDPEIYLLAASRLGVRPEECVFVDDLRPNAAAAAALGMVGVHHVDVDGTVAELERIFGVPLR